MYLNIFSFPSYFNLFNSESIAEGAFVALYFRTYGSINFRIFYLFYVILDWCVGSLVLFGPYFLFNDDLFGLSFISLKCGGDSSSGKSSNIFIIYSLQEMAMFGLVSTTSTFSSSFPRIYCWSSFSSLISCFPSMESKFYLLIHNYNIIIKAVYHRPLHKFSLTSIFLF